MLQSHTHIERKAKDEQDRAQVSKCRSGFTISGNRIFATTFVHALRDRRSFSMWLMVKLRRWSACACTHLHHHTLWYVIFRYLYLYCANSNISQFLKYVYLLWLTQVYSLLSRLRKKSSRSLKRTRQSFADRGINKAMCLQWETHIVVVERFYSAMHSPQRFQFLFELWALMGASLFCSGFGQ